MMIQLKYSDILKKNLELRKTVNGNEFKIAILSNIICHQLNEIIEFSLRSNGINASVIQCDYNNIVQSVEKCSEYNAAIIFWEAANILDGLYYKINLFNKNEIEALTDKTIKEIKFVINQLKHTPIVMFNKFSSSIFNYHFQKENNFDLLCNALNETLNNNISSNIRLINLENILTDISIKVAVDMRYFYSSKALYTVEFYKHYAEHITPILLSTVGKTKKALILDCDNTLWKGILEEDGFEGIRMSAHDKDGLPYHEVQHLALELSRKGVIIGLCSKNNAEDIEQVFLHHRDVVLANEDISIKKVNWIDKVTNLKEMARDLNISTDSIVYVDDSDFETDYVKAMMPEITIIKVPENKYEYPSLIRKAFGYFYSSRETNEDSNRTQMYIKERLRAKEKEKYSSIDEYLKSLNINLDVYINDQNIVQRMAQLTQKTNQFNLTTKRYTDTEISKLLFSDNHLLVAIAVKDKFGDNGVTALSIIKLTRETAEIDTFLLSCRILGRKIEFTLFDFIVEQIRNKGIPNIKATYLRTIKNQQVEYFYDNIGFLCTDETDNLKHYMMETAKYITKNINYVKIN